MNPALRAQQRYREEAILSASPERLLTMLYDRLVLDIERGEAAQLRGDRETANTELQHAQQIVTELAGSLSAEWEGSAGLRALYGYLTRELIGANISRDASRTRACLDIVLPLRDAWHAAAETMTVA
ncbi:flagellar export chaperone FliS [Microbacterium sp. T2.11-28]|uniref:flagellar export chaperone FliS n=1 Tax=unclassified Microbacterium TaxID=2609290 RepID=UPI002477C298|nr:flagellar export chaperone FliS [Microbacterium sp. T2.11-28]CAI9389177.1 Flagellar secretion chaperone FliS [Microbacterium sp. T2.11-28]